jgi:NAD(P)H dehydrogenase (quinone)
VAEQAQKAASITQAVKRAGVKHVVFLSSVAAQFPDGTGPIKTVRPLERDLPTVAPRTTFVRAAYFLENWGGSLGAINDGIFPTFLRADVPFDMVATADIGRVAADALLSGGAKGTDVIELASGAGPQSPRDIAGLVGQIIGRELQVVQGPAAAIVPTLTGFGFSNSVAGLYAEMIGAFNAATSEAWERKGWFVRGPTSAEAVLRGLLGR